MVGVVRTKLSEGDKLVLVNPEQTRVIQWFEIQVLTSDRILKVVDGDGRVFASSDERGLWIHSLVMLRFPPENLSYSQRNGYRYMMEIHVNDMHRIHYAGFLKDKYPSLYKQLPLRVQEEE